MRNQTVSIQRNQFFRPLRDSDSPQTSKPGITPASANGQREFEYEGYDQRPNQRGPEALSSLSRTAIPAAYCASFNLNMLTSKLTAKSVKRIMLFYRIDSRSRFGVLAE